MTDPFGRTFLQAVEFKWRPVFCKKCLKMGHDCSKKSTTERHKEQWRKPKKIVQKWMNKGHTTQRPTTKKPIENKSTKPTPGNTTMIEVQRGVAGHVLPTEIVKAMGKQKDKQVEETTHTVVITQIIVTDNPSMSFDIATTNGFQ